MEGHPVTEEEIPLAGGTIRHVVKVGDTVRRATGNWSPTVHALLQHLHESGFDAAPRFLGIDDEGREILTYIDGDVTANGHVQGRESTEALLVVAQKLRAYHDVVAKFVPPPDAVWSFQPGAPRTGDIICHNDLGSHNTIYRNGLPYAFIDWDYAAPGTRLWDVVYAAWHFVPLFDNDLTAAFGWPLLDTTKRLVQFCDAYGLEDRSMFVETLLQRAQVIHDFFVDGATNGEPAFIKFVNEGRPELVLRNMAYIREKADRWQAALA